MVRSGHDHLSWAQELPFLVEGETLVTPITLPDEIATWARLEDLPASVSVTLNVAGASGAAPRLFVTVDGGELSISADSPDMEDRVVEAVPAPDQSARIAAKMAQAAAWGATGGVDTGIVATESVEVPQ